MKRRIQSGWIIITLILLVSTGIRAQEAYSTLSYSIGIPTGDMADFVETASWRGVAFDYNNLLGQNFALGIGFSWQTFYEELGFQTLTDGTVNLSGSQYNYVNSFPVHLTGSYFFQSESFITPFAGLGVGTIYNMTDLDIGIFRFEENAWQFSVRPEVGMQFEVNYRTGARVSARYFHAFEAENLGSYSHLALTVGIVWIY